MHSRKRTFFTSTLLSAAASLSLLGAQPTQAKPAPESQEKASANTTSMSMAKETRMPSYQLSVGLAGYSPVSYLDSNKAEPGSPRYAAEYQGVTYFMTTQAQLHAFTSNPQRYLPAYGGFCAYGCAVGAKFVPAPESFKIVDGRTNLFLKNEQIDTLNLWNTGNQMQLKKKADQYWQGQTQSRAYTGARNVPADGIALDGYSPVSYFTQNAAQKGDARFAVEHNGVTYLLTSQQQVELFKQNPSRYEPQYGGWCAFGMAISDKFPVDPTKFKITNDKLYLFLDNAKVNALHLWEKGNESELVSKADAHWKKVAG
jgi:YHS domain-containing protein